MEKSCFKVFFSKYKECEWLNEMGADGYFLTKINDSRYYFEYYEEHKFSYSIEHIGVSAQSEDAAKYFDARRAEGIIPVISGGSWIYFYAKDRKIINGAEVHRKNSQLFFWRAIYLFFFALTGAILCGYHTFASSFIKNAGHEGVGKIKLLQINGDTILDTLKSLWNNVLDFLNDTYLKLFANIFGESDAAIVLSVLIPLTAVITVFFALNLNEYITCRLKMKNADLSLNNAETEGEENAEQGI